MDWNWVMISMVRDGNTGPWKLNYNKLSSGSYNLKPDDTISVNEQMDTMLKKALITARLSAKSFYRDNSYDSYSTGRFSIDED